MGRNTPVRVLFTAYLWNSASIIRPAQGQTSVASDNHAQVNYVYSITRKSIVKASINTKAVRLADFATIESVRATYSNARG